MNSEKENFYWDSILKTIKLVQYLKKYQREHPAFSRSLIEFFDNIEEDSLNGERLNEYWNSVLQILKISKRFDY